MKTKIFLLWALALFAFTVSSCKNDGNEPEPEPPIKTLAGTKWKLAKLTHTETKVERPIFIGDEVFTQFVPTMNFETDTTGYLVYYPYDHYWREPFANSNGIPFNINKINTKYPTDYVGWFNPDIFAPDNIGEFVLYTAGNLLGYKVEDNLLKLFCPDDGFFYFNKNREIIMMYSQFGLCTDTNWYNCLVFEKVK
jgi:hypothetical protein